MKPRTLVIFLGVLLACDNKVEALAVQAVGRYWALLPDGTFHTGLKPGTQYAIRGSDGILRTFDTKPAIAMQRIVADGKRFASADGTRFVPWGNNYVSVGGAATYAMVDDEMFTDEGLARIATDLDRHTNVYPPDGITNVVRMHLQLHKLMIDADTVNAEAFARFVQVVEMAEDRGLYVMITGINEFFPADNPEWVEAQSEADHWQTQALWWHEMARSLAASPGVFLYDLMNEPIVPVGAHSYGAMLPYCDYGGDPAKGTHGTCFVQFITNDLAGRDRATVATAWVKAMKAAIRQVDERHLITVGAAGTGMLDPFQAASVHAELDVISPHLYPEGADMGQHEIDFAAFQSNQSGKPVVVGETFSLPGSPERMISETCRAGTAAGWIGQQNDTTYKMNCSLPPPWACAFWDAWYELQAKLGPTILAGNCP